MSEKKQEALPLAAEVRHLNRSFRDVFSRHYADKMPNDLSHIEAMVIEFIAESDDKEVYSTTIATYFRLKKSTVSEMLHGLTKKGYLTLARGTKDRRWKPITLTEKAWEREAKIRPINEEFEKSIADVLSPEDKEQFDELCAKIEDGLKKHI